MAASNQIPANSDKLLFAEDLVNFVMRHHTNDIPQQCTAEPYRKSLYNGFNEAAKTAVRYYDEREASYHDIIYQYISKKNEVNSSIYVKFAEEIKQDKFPNGFDANNFFLLCYLFAVFAAHCYNFGVVEAPTLAVLYIVNAMQGFDMDNGGWEFLNSIAERYVPMALDCANEITPKNDAV